MKILRAIKICVFSMHHKYVMIPGDSFLPNFHFVDWAKKK